MDIKFVTSGHHRFFSELKNSGGSDCYDTFVCFRREDASAFKDFLKKVLSESPLPDSLDGDTHHYISGCDCSINVEAGLPYGMVALPCIQSTFRWLVEWDYFMESIR